MFISGKKSKNICKSLKKTTQQNWVHVETTSENWREQGRKRPVLAEPRLSAVSEGGEHGLKGRKWCFCLQQLGQNQGWSRWHQSHLATAWFWRLMAVIFHKESSKTPIFLQAVLCSKTDHNENGHFDRKMNSSKVSTGKKNTIKVEWFL